VLKNIFRRVVGEDRAKTVDEWVPILGQAHLWKAESLKAKAARKLDDFDLEPVKRIVWWHQYGLPHSRSLIRSYSALCRRRVPITFLEASTLGVALFVKLAEARDRHHHQTVCECCASDPIHERSAEERYFGGWNCGRDLPAQEIGLSPSRKTPLC
jgi:hypothetical protein